MKQLVLNEADLQQLNNFINELPFKYGAPLANFLNQKSQEQAPQPAQPVVVDTEVK